MGDLGAEAGAVAADEDGGGGEAVVDGAGLEVDVAECVAGAEAGAPGGQRREGAVVCGAAAEGRERGGVWDELVGEEEGAVGGGGGAVEARDGGVVAVAEHGEAGGDLGRVAPQCAAEDGGQVAPERAAEGVGGGRGEAVGGGEIGSGGGELGEGGREEAAEEEVVEREDVEELILLGRVEIKLQREQAYTGASLGLREDAIVPIPSKYLGGNANESGKEDVDDVGNGRASDKEDAEGGDGSDSADSEFYDSDWDAEDGDDDLFLDNVDKDVNDNNEATDIVEQEDDAGLEHEDLNLSKEEYSKLTYKFNEFNGEVDMEAQIFKVGMLFSSMEEFRRALNTYSVNERVKIKKTRNEATRLHAIWECFHEFGCPWKIKVSLDNRKEAYTVKEYCNDHICEKVWELKTLTAPFLTTCFMDEFRDNQELDLKAFAAKVQRRFNMCPNRFKLERATKAALNIIHGDEEEQFVLLCDYGQELRRSNPGSKFFLSTNQIKEHSDPEPKEHLATLYWSYDAYKRILW
ncbi:hypothetical protein ACQ4PT_057014 [Festuca glaucescens]